jgi:hypothetical protein
MTTETALDPEQVQLAAQVYMYGYPLVYDLTEVENFVEGKRLPFAAPYNHFGYARNLLGPETKFVSPNNDTLYTVAMCDLREGPLVLRVPDTNGRYYVLQLIDAWTNNFAYLGRRATGTEEAEFLLAPEEWAGETPAGMKLVPVPTDVFTIGGRIQVDGEADLPTVHALQDQFTLTPLSDGRAGAGPSAGIPEGDPRVPDELKWWEQFRVALAAFPPPAADAPFLELAGKFGVTNAQSPYVEPDASLAAVLVAAESAAKQKIEELGKGGGADEVNGWNYATHMFDYNLDHLGVGTIDAPEWKIAERARAYVTRAVVARAGLWGNHGYEANYAFVWNDADGDPLDGSVSRYELRLPKPPPVDAFWSLTMYDVPDFYLVANPIDRYSIGDRTPGLKTESDGTVTIYIQKEAPEPDKQSNWLPAPDSRFRPLMRMYQPRREILDREFVLPPVTKAS